MTRSGAPSRAVALAIAVILGTAAPALAHTGAGGAGGFLAGFSHPILGWDHVVAMVAVGLWGAFLGLPALWVLPVIFPLVMAFGAVLGILNVPVPAIETGIAASAVVLGILIAMAVRAPLWVAASIVGVFAIFHGYAHGAELPGSVNAFAFAVGFVVATGMLHLIGIGFGLLVRHPAGEAAVRGLGAAISLAGVAFLAGWV